MPDSDLPKTERTIYTVSKINARVRQLLLDHLEPLWLEGEISNLSRPASGHIYFSLKDDRAQINCAMFRGRNQSLNFAPKDGMLVTVHARADLYEARGNFQLIVNFMEIAGTGELQRRFERLKQRLAAEGLFDQQRKQTLPEIPRRVGVITSASGAALHDVLTTLNKRFPALEVFVYPAVVQGDEAPASICAMLELSNARREVDVLILTRGGGSLEDLWAFNDESVARAIAASALPVVTGIGHEVDFTIADFVADKHLPTPTAAAQHLSPDQEMLAQNLANIQKHLSNCLDEQISYARQQLALKQEQLLRFHPTAHIEQRMQRLDDAAARLHSGIHDLINHTRQQLTLLQTTLGYQAPIERIRTTHARLMNAATALGSTTKNTLRSHQHHLRDATARLNVLSPLATLKRGYSITTDEQGRIIGSIAPLSSGQKIGVRVADGRILASINKLRR